MNDADTPFNGEVLRRQSLAKYTAARLGGMADYLYVCKDPGFEKTIDVLRRAWSLDLPVTVLGGGANVLVADSGIRGLTLINRAARITHEVQEDVALVQASSGVNLIRLARYCQENGVAGMEWAIGVPGTIGGAVVNNAGAHDGDIASTLQEALVYEEAEGERGYAAGELDYAYRHSQLKRREDRRFFVLRAIFRLRRAAPAGIQARMDAYNAYRKSTQPPGASLGSIFKNPPGDFAGRLIEAAGLKGYRLGAVQVSPIHANFFVNTGGAASAEDYRTLIDYVQQRVQSASGIRLELEIELLGEWG